MKTLTKRSASLVITALVGAPCLAFAIANLAAYNQPESVTYAVTYEAFGKPSSKWVIIRYNDRLSYGARSIDELPSVRVPASALPWRKTVELSEARSAFVVIEEGDKLNKGQLAVSISVNGKWQSSTAGEHNDRIFALQSLRSVVK